MNHLGATSFCLLLACGGSVTSVDAGPVDAPPRTDGGLASEWTDTPYLSPAPIRSFAAAGDAITPGVDYGARIVTDVGTVVVDLTEVETPVTVESFVFLARNHFFDGIAFHRVINGFMAQSGDPNSVDGAPSTWGTGGPGYEFADEIEPSFSYDAPGVLGMANRGPGTNGSQFFITFAPATHLDGLHTIFGHVIADEGALASIARGQPPAVPTRIRSVQIIER